MPTSDEYERAAALFTRAEEGVRAVLQPVKAGTGPNVLRGGRLTASVDDLIAEGDARLRVVADELAELAARSRTLGQVQADAEAEAQAALSLLATGQGLEVSPG